MDVEPIERYDHVSEPINERFASGCFLELAEVLQATAL